jgi:hypothetical protein
VTPVDLPWATFEDHLLVVGLSFLEVSSQFLFLQDHLLVLSISSIEVSAVLQSERGCMCEGKGWVRLEANSMLL